MDAHATNLEVTVLVATLGWDAGGWGLGWGQDRVEGRFLLGYPFILFYA